MMRVSEFVVFGGVALAAHGAAFLVWPGESSAPGGAGAGGNAKVTLDAASAFESLAASWDIAPIVRLSPPGLSVPAPDAFGLPDLGGNVGATVSDLTVVHLSTQDRDIVPDLDTESPSVVQRFLQQRPAPRPDEVSLGTGGDSAGTTDAGGVVLSRAERKSLLAAWGAQIRNEVEEAKRAPRNVRDTGRTILRITVSREGQLEAARVLEGAGSERLDQAALEAVRRAGVFPSAPEALDLARMSFDLPIQFTR